MENSTYYQIKSIVKAFKLMELLVTKNEFELAELCRLLECPKTTVHRMLLTLQSLGYVEQNHKNLHYGASMKLFELGGKVIHNLSFIEIARPLMIELSEKTSETINLGILKGIDVVCVDVIPSKHRLKLDQPIGFRSKAYCWAMGKAILAFLPKEERAQLFSEYGIISDTPKSLKTVSAVEKDLQRIQERGYSVDNEESGIGVRCVGAPIFKRNLEVIAGISIAGPTSRLKEQHIEHLGKLVIETAASISNRLGASTEVLPKPSM